MSDSERELLITSISWLELKPGDILIVKIPHSTPLDSRERILAYISKIVDSKVIVCPDTFEFSILNESKSVSA